MKTIFKTGYTILLLIYTLNLYSQNWTSLNGGANSYVTCIYGDTLHNVLYAIGDFTTIGGINANQLGQWNGSTWDSVGHGLPNPTSCQHVFTIYNGELVCVNNIFDFLQSHVAKWNGTQWDSIGNNFTNDYMSAFRGVVTLNNELYVYGSFDSVNHIYYNSIAKWDGQNWLPIGFPYRFDDNTPDIASMIMYNNELYVAGGFSDYTPHMVNIAKYDGTTWSVVGGGFDGPMDQVVDLEIYKGELYAAGTFSIADGNAFNYIARWNGSEWHDVGGGVTSPDNGQIFDLLTYNDKLYACGYFTEMGGITARHFAAWDGNNWCGFGTTDSVGITGLATMNHDLYVVCAPILDGIPVGRIAKWIGGNYVDTCGNTTGISEIATNKDTFTIYPNPATNQITIGFPAQTKNVSIEIKNILGETIYSEKTEMQSSKTIDISGFSNGVYFLQVQNSGSIVSKKFVKQ